MATWIYKKNDKGEVESELLEAYLVPGALASGWSCEDPSVKKKRKSSKSKDLHVELTENDSNEVEEG